MRSKYYYSTPKASSEFFPNFSSNSTYAAVLVVVCVRMVMVVGEDGGSGWLLLWR
ncbi:hypothetical protein ACJIZ3_016975 [Penstemon smallii]|uniref:Transmembrane protein n=1 Tax=Penstemon smallii TaxID=265156 RepID=A0ABD3SUM2_9LAMI